MNRRRPKRRKHYSEDAIKITHKKYKRNRNKIEVQSELNPVKAGKDKDDSYMFARVE